MTIRIKVRCEGVTPILFNRKPLELLQELWSKEKKAKTASRPSPREHCERALYKTEKGECYIPGEMLMASLISAGSFVRLDGKRQISSAKSTVLPAFLTLLDHQMILPDQRWEADLRGGCNPNGGEAVAICRPRFDRWGFTVEILVEDSEIDEAKIRQLFDYAGTRMGLGDFRPQRKGIFGKFRVACWDRVAETQAEAAE
mgnify:CR=1 FL=1